jgi:hypothetical protein
MYLKYLLIGIGFFIILINPSLAYIPTEDHCHIWSPYGAIGLTTDNNGNLTYAGAFGGEDYNWGLISVNTSDLCDQTLPGTTPYFDTDANLTSSNILGMTYANNSHLYWAYKRNFQNGTVMGAVLRTNITGEQNYDLWLNGDFSWKFMNGLTNESRGAPAHIGFLNIEILGAPGGKIFQLRNFTFTNQNSYVLNWIYNFTNVTTCANWGTITGKDLDITIDDDYIYVLVPKCVNGFAIAGEKIVHALNSTTREYLWSVDIFDEFGIRFPHKIASDDTWTYLASASTRYTGYEVIWKLNLSLVSTAPTNLTAISPINDVIVKNETFNITAYLNTTRSGNLTWFLNDVNLSVVGINQGFAGLLYHEINSTTLDLNNGAHNWSAYWVNDLAFIKQANATFVFSTGAMGGIIEWIGAWIISCDIQGVDDVTRQRCFQASMSLMVLVFAVVISIIVGYVSQSGSVAVVTMMGSIFGFTAIGWMELWVGIIMMIIGAGLMSLKFFVED